MLYLLASILFSASILILFRLFTRFGIDNLQAIIANYFVAALIGFSSQTSLVGISQVSNAPWFLMSLVLGTIFIGVFFLFALSSQKAGVSITAVASRMSVVIPVLGGFVLFGEQAGWVKIAGITLAFPAFYLTFKRKQEKSRTRNILFYLLPVFIFFGTGANDLLMKYTDFHYVKNDLMLLLASIFCVAMIYGLLVFGALLIAGRTSILLKSWAAGVFLGLINFGSTYYMFRSMVFFESSVMFPILNTGVVSLAALADYFIFKQRLSPINMAGIALSLVAIILISIG